jgi:diguanylate cyclase
MGRFDARTITVDEFADWIETSQRILTATRDYESRLRSSEREAQGLRSELVKIRKLADIDPLTELPNRRGFEQLLEDELRKANEQVEQLVIAFCDIDHFKAINDNWGHETGDRVLRSVGQRFARMTDDKCHAARHGGEEFVMLFRGISAEEARQRIDEVRLSLSRTRFVNEAAGQAIGAVTFSGGVADVFAHDNPRDALGAADKALYRAKQSGRNRVLLEGEGEDAD